MTLHWTSFLLLYTAVGSVTETSCVTDDHVNKHSLQVIPSLLSEPNPLLSSMSCHQLFNCQKLLHSQTIDSPISPFRTPCTSFMDKFPLLCVHSLGCPRLPNVAEGMKQWCNAIEFRLCSFLGLRVCVPQIEILPSYSIQGNSRTS